MPADTPGLYTAIRSTLHLDPQQSSPMRIAVTSQYYETITSHREFA